MAKVKARQQQQQLVRQSSESLRETLKLLDRPAPSGLERVPWTDVLKVAELVSKQATTTGMLFCGSPTALESTEKIKSYVNELQGFLLLCHGSTVGAGPTLLSVVRDHCTKVLNASLELMDASVRPETQAARKEALPPLSGCVWGACDAMKKAPSDNRTAVGRAIVQAGTSMKDVLRELNEIEAKETRPDSEDDDEPEASGNESQDCFDLDVSCSKAEKVVVGKVRDCVAVVLDVMRQVLYVISKAKIDDEASLNKLEAVLEDSKVIGRQVDELGASSMPPQEIEQLREQASNVGQAIEQLTRNLACLSADGELPQALLSEFEKASFRLSELRDELSRVDAVSQDLETLAV